MKNNFLIEINNDVLDIVSAIKSVDNRYRLFYNKKNCRFELYSLKGLNLVMEVVCPYPELDNRFLIKVKQTRVENSKKLIEQMDRDNEKMILNEQNALLDKTQIKAKEMLDYADKKSTDIDFSTAYQNQWF